MILKNVAKSSADSVEVVGLDGGYRNTGGAPYYTMPETYVGLRTKAAY